MHNSESGTLDLTGITTNGSIACLAGNYIPYESSWTNDGTILASATAYGGSYPGFTGSAFSNHACAISVYSNYDALMMTNNGYMDLYAVNYGQNKGYEYAIGMEFESSATNFINKGTIDIQALQGYTFGMYLPTLEEDSFLKNYGDGTYSFIQPDEVVTVTVKYSAGGSGGTTAEGCPSAKYKDIDTNQWYHYYIDYVLRNHLMIGTSDTEFSPDDTLTRAEAVMVLWRLAGEPMVKFDMDFEDVPELQWYTEAIRWSASEKVIEGYGDGTFGTEDPITKEQLSAILWRYAKSEGYDVFGGEDFDLSVFTDESSISDYAYDAVKWACGADIIRGNGDGTLNPAGDMKRSEFSTMMMYFIENIIR